MWPRRIFGPCVTSAMSFTRSAVPVCVFSTVCSMSCTLLKSPSARTFICCMPDFDEAAAGIDVVVGELLLHLADAQAVGDQLVRIDAHLVLAHRAAEVGNVHDVGNGLELLEQNVQSSMDLSSIRS